MCLYVIYIYIYYTNLKYRFPFQNNRYFVSLVFSIRSSVYKLKLLIKDKVKYMTDLEFI